MINSHVAYKKLVLKWMNEDLAEVVTELMEERQNDLATKSDIFKLENKIDINMKWIMAIGVVIIGLLLKNAFI
jgi:sporulation protein YlmC with PRC-barrel domain